MDVSINNASRALSNSEHGDYNPMLLSQTQWFTTVEDNSCMYLFPEAHNLYFELYLMFLNKLVML